MITILPILLWSHQISSNSLISIDQIVVMQMIKFAAGFFGNIQFNVGYTCTLHTCFDSKPSLFIMIFLNSLNFAKVKVCQTLKKIGFVRLKNGSFFPILWHVITFLTKTSDQLLRSSSRKGYKLVV